MYKYFWLFATLLSVWSFTPSPHFTFDNNAISLEDAVKQKLVKVQFLHNSEGTHYMNPLFVKVQNLQNSALRLQLNTGYFVVPEDSMEQTLVTTRALAINLKPKQNASYTLSAMCTEPSDRAPNQKSRYNLGQKSNENLEKLTQLISKRKYYNSQGQSAIWALTADYPLEGVNGFQPACRDSLLDLLCTLTGKSKPDKKTLEDYRYNPQSQVMKTAVSGRLTFDLFKNAKVLVALFNKNHVQVRDLYYQPQAPEGQQSVFYKFDSTVYTDDFYYVKTLVNDKVLFERKFEMR